MQRTLSWVAILVLALTAAETSTAQSLDRVEKRSGTWTQLGTKDPMTDVTTWLPFITTSNLVSPAGAPLLAEDAAVVVLCIADTTADVSFTFSFNEPVAGHVVPDGDSIAAQFRFGSERALEPTWLLNTPDTSGSFALALPSALGTTFLTQFRRANRMLLRVSSDGGGQNYYFSLDGFTAAWSHCRREWKALYSRLRRDDHGGAG